MPDVSQAIIIGNIWAPTSDRSRHRYSAPASVGSRRLSKRRKLDHPLITKDQFNLRKRVVQFLSTAYSVMREGNIIFVCGGLSATDMRFQFLDYCKIKHPEFEVFFPEYAIKNYFANAGNNQFNIADFEELIGQLSHAIVVFPEAAGSYAETGFFSAIEGLASKTILAMDSRFQSRDSFISIGPAMKFNATSRFNDVIQLVYQNPDFEIVAKRINRFPLNKNRRALKLKAFRELSTFEVFCLIQKLFDLLRIATIDDIIFLFNSIFHGQFSKAKIIQLTSILAGANYIRPVGAFGHYTTTSKPVLLQVLKSYESSEVNFRMELAGAVERANPEFVSLFEEAHNVT